jgi:hypothetical protein
MRTELLIQKLASDLPPVRPLGRPITRLAQWLFITSVLICLAVFLSGSRPDIAAAVVQPAFLLRTLLILGIGAAAAFAALSFSIPGDSERWPILASVAGIAVFLGLLAFTLFSEGSFVPGPGKICLRNVVGLGIVTGAILCGMLRQAAPLKAGLVGLLASLGAAALANFGTQFICRHDSPAHLLVWHILPVAALCGAGIVAGRLLFRWNDQRRKAEAS